MTLEQAIKMVYETYDGMFKNDNIVLSELDKFLRIVATFGDDAFFTVYNLLLLKAQKPDCFDILSEKDLIDRRINNKTQGATPVSLISQKNSQYEVSEYYDIADFDVPDRSKPRVVSANSEIVLKAVIRALFAMNWNVSHVTPISVSWRDFARASNPDPNCIVATILWRNPTKEEEATMDKERIYANICKDIFKSYALATLFYLDEFKTLDSFPNKYLPTAELFANLMCVRYGLYDLNSISFVHIPKAIEGRKCEFKEFRECFDDVAYLMKDMCDIVEYFINHILNPVPPIEVTVTATVEASGGDAD